MSSLLVLLSCVCRKEEQSFETFNHLSNTERAPNFDAVVPSRCDSESNRRHWDPSSYIGGVDHRINIHWHRIMADHRSLLYTVSTDYSKYSSFAEAQ
jgi:hypothetical protein